MLARSSITEAAKALAYRAVENTCTSAAHGVGLPVQMAVVTADGVELVSDGDESHTNVKDTVDLWKAKEVEVLGELAPTPSLPTEVSGAPEPSLNENEILKSQEPAA